MVSLRYSSRVEPKIPNRNTRLRPFMRLLSRARLTVLYVDTHDLPLYSHEANDSRA
nr:MAG TPA: hypothetical protein [Caudoviricetes sp.]